MDHLLASLAVGGMPPALTPGRWDAAPLLLAVGLALLMRRANLRPPIGVFLPIALVGGLVLDAIDDAIGLSLATTMALGAMVFAIVSLRRTRAA